MSFIAERMGRIDSSGIRKVFALAATLKDPINLSIGQPDYDVDDAVKEVAIDQIRKGFNRYTQTWGIDELREEVVAYYERRFGASIENAMIVGGVSGGLFLTLMATVNPGDEVIVADPYFVMYKHLTNLLGGVCSFVDTYPDFKLRAEAIEKVITPKSKVLIVNSPSNPTGVTLTRDEMKEIADVAKKHNLLVITDDIYEQFSYDAPPASMAGLYENTVVLNGFSKSAGMTGWRIGYAAGPKDIINEMNTLQQYTFVCAPSFAQKAAVVSLHQDTSKKIETYRHKRDLIADGLERIGYTLARPTGAFYAFPEAPGGDGDAFVKKAIENSLLIIPGSVFSERKTHFRLSFAADDHVINRGLEVLDRLKREF